MPRRRIAETTDCEFKREVETTRPKSWLKTVCAFANGHGGMIAFGIDDDRSVVGVADPQVDIERIGRLVKDRIDPTPEFQLEATIESGRCIVELSVLEGDQAPYCYSADGEYRAYVRMGSESCPASAAQLKALVMKGTRTHFDELVSDLECDRHSFDLLKATYYERLRKPLKPEDLVSFGLATADGKLTNAGRSMAAAAEQNILHALERADEGVFDEGCSGRPRVRGMPSAPAEPRKGLRRNAQRDRLDENAEQPHRRAQLRFPRGGGGHRERAHTPRLPDRRRGGDGIHLRRPFGDHVTRQQSRRPAST